MIRQVLMVRDWGKEVEIGGPAATFMHAFICPGMRAWVRKSN